MCTAFRCYDIVYKTENRLAVSIVVLESNLNINIIFLAFTVYYIIIYGCLCLIEICNEFLDTACIMKTLLDLLLTAVIPQVDAKTFSKKCSLSETLF